MNFGSYEYHGNLGVLMSDPGTLTTDRTKLQTCTAEFTCPANSFRSLPNIGSVHPIFGTITMERRVVSVKGAYAVAQCCYAGIDEDETAPVYETISGLCESPIETHPNFTAFAGTPSAPINGANFRKGDMIVNAASPSTTGDSGYVFEGFDVMVGGVRNEFAGVTSYLEAGQITFRATWNVRKWVPGSAAGKIGSPSGPAPAIVGTWLDMGFTSTQRGSVYQVSREWRASGRRGWNAQIYG